MRRKPGHKYIKYTPLEQFILGVYRDIDTEIKRELDKLSHSGAAPVCQKGCYYCCRQKVPIALPESHILAQYIQRYFSTRQKDALRERTAAWFDWVSRELPRYGNNTEDETAAFYDHGPYCPLLVEGNCSVYTARPFVCRTHFEFSSLEHCRSYNAMLNARDDQTVIRRILNAVKPFAMQIKDSVEAQGINFEESMVLVPLGLSLELEWSELLRGK